MKKLLPFLLILLLTACAAPHSAMPALSPDPTLTVPTATPTPVPTQTSTPPPRSTIAYNVPVTYTVPITVDNGRVLTLVLHGNRSSEKYLFPSHVHAIEVLDESGSRLQYIDRVENQSFYDIESDLTTRDVNFDGAGDIGLALAQGNFTYFLWKEDLQQFEYAFCMFYMEIDEQNQLVIENYSDNRRTWTTKYAFGKNDEMILMQHDSEEWIGETYFEEIEDLQYAYKDAYRIIHQERINGELVETYNEIEYRTIEN